MGIPARKKQGDESDERKKVLFTGYRCLEGSTIYERVQRLFVIGKVLSGPNVIFYDILIKMELYAYKAGDFQGFLNFVKSCKNCDNSNSIAIMKSLKLTFKFYLNSITIIN
jgi:hypothetical protein